MPDDRAYQPDLIRGLPYWRIRLQDYIVGKVLVATHTPSRKIRILDLGCGLGYTLARFSRLLPRGSETIGIDVEPETIKRATMVVKSFGETSSVKLYLANAEETPFDDDHFDVIVANLSFSVFENAGKAASEVARILKPGGKLVVSEVSSRSVIGRMGELLDTLTHHLYYMLYSPKALADLFVSLGFRVDNITRIPLAIRVWNRSLSVPSAISPAFSVELSKPHRLYQVQRVE